MKIAFIGAGVMGEAMVRGVLAAGVSAPQDIAVSDIASDRLDALRSKYSVATSEASGTAIEHADVVVLAVKPQNLPGLIPALNGQIAGDRLVLSIIAGARLDTLMEGLGHPAVVRAMPNTPAQIGEGMSVWTAASQVSQGQREMAASILGALGKEVYVPDEGYIDMATAVSGSGPAYIYLFIESLVDAAVSIGLPRQMAQELVLQTVLGAARLAQQTGAQPAELRQMVTSKGGTTEAGLARLEEGDLRTLVQRGVAAAYQRSQELGG